MWSPEANICMHIYMIPSLRLALIISLQGRHVITYSPSNLYIFTVINDYSNLLLITLLSPLILTPQQSQVPYIVHIDQML